MQFTKVIVVKKLVLLYGIQKQLNNAPFKKGLEIPTENWEFTITNKDYLIENS